MVAAGLKLAAGFELDQAQDDVAVAFAWPAQGAQAVEDVRLQPDQPLAVSVGLALEAH